MDEESAVDDQEEHALPGQKRQRQYRARRNTEADVTDSSFIADR